MIQRDHFNGSGNIHLFLGKVSYLTYKVKCFNKDKPQTKIEIEIEHYFTYLLYLSLRKMNVTNKKFNVTKYDPVVLVPVQGFSKF